jgi:hypothetical protein
MASKFWVGGGSNTNWNSSPVTNWANSSGGAGNQTAPATGDSVFFDGNSGTGASVWNTAISLATLNCSLSKNVITHNAVTITISSGDLKLPTGVGGSYTAAGSSSLFTMTGTAGTQKITTNGFKPGSLTLNGAGGTFQLQDNFSTPLTANGAITLTNGTFDGQSFTVSCSTFSGVNSNTKALGGSGLWTLGLNNATGNLWNISATGTTLTSFTSGITITGTTASTRVFVGAGLTYQGTLTVGANTSGGVFGITGSDTFGNLAVTAPNCIRLPTSSQVITLSNAPTIAGSPGNEICFLSDSPGTNGTLSLASGTASFSWCGFRDISCSGGAAFTANNSFDLGDNSGITINAPNTTRSRIQSGF